MSTKKLNTNEEALQGLINQSTADTTKKNNERATAIGELEKSIKDPALREQLRAVRSMARPGRPKKKEVRDEERACIIAKKEHMEKIRTIAFTEGVAIKDVIREAFELAINKYESKNGVIEIVDRDNQPTKKIF